MSTTGQTTTVEQAVHAALGTVEDPEIHRPITELGMVKSVAVSPDGRAEVAVYLTVAGCPMRETITKRVTDAVSAVTGISSVGVTLDVMSEEQRAELRRSLRGDATRSRLRPASVSSAATPRPSPATGQRDTSPAFSSRSTSRVTPDRLSSTASASSVIRSRCSGASTSCTSTS